MLKDKIGKTQNHLNGELNQQMEVEMHQHGEKILQVEMLTGEMIQA